MSASSLQAVKVLTVNVLANEKQWANIKKLVFYTLILYKFSYEVGLQRNLMRVFREIKFIQQ